jgi:hypothetical protein
METTNIILAISTISGPIVAALIAIYYTRYADRQKIKNIRRFEVFRNLMKTRGLPLHADRVMSLNLIQSDFSDDADTMEKFRKYINHLYRPLPSDASQHERFFAERELLFGKLLVSIANSLKININADEVKHFQYSPVGWASIEVELQQIRTLLINVLQGITPISVRDATQHPGLAQSPGALFPPPPTNNEVPR